MAISRNGWDVYTSRSHPKLVNFPWITGKVRDGDHFVVLDYIARRIHTEVEKIVKGNSWGHDPRPVRGYTDVWSEHATGTCFDFNAPKNGLGVPIIRSFSAAQISQIRQIIKDVRGAARWGGEWARPDGMHVELIGGNAKIMEVADLIRAGKLPGLGKPGDVAPAGKPKPSPKPPAKPASKSVATMAAEVIAGKHGNGHDARRKSLGVSAGVYEQVRAEVNKRAGSKTPAPKPAGKSIAQMATEVIAGKHGNGHSVRQKSLGIDSATYARVKAEVNRKA